MTRYDAIFVPGGGLGIDGTVPPWVAARLDRALELPGAAPIVTLSAGTPYKAMPLDASGQPVFESVAGARYLVGRGAPAERVYVETSSFDTIGNAYFSRVIHAEPRRWRRIAVVTSEFHMARTEVAFGWIYRLTPQAVEFELRFLPVPDVGMDPEIRRARQRKEAESLAVLRELSAGIVSMEQLHQWLFTAHSAYNSRSPAPAAVDAAVRGSY